MSARGRVEVARRLIREHHRRSRDQRPGDRHTLLLAGWQGPRERHLASAGTTSSIPLAVVGRRPRSGSASLRWQRARGQRRGTERESSRIGLR